MNKHTSVLRKNARKNEPGYATRLLKLWASGLLLPDSAWDDDDLFLIIKQMADLAYAKKHAIQTARRADMIGTTDDSRKG